jgi:uncharacterized protein (TIGR02757 family)
VDHTSLRGLLDSLRRRYSTRRHARRDPVSLLYGLDASEVEVGGMIVAFLAYGRLAQIMRSARQCLERLEGAPREFILSRPEHQLREACRGFRHRVVAESNMFSLLMAMRAVLLEYGSIQAGFLAQDSMDSRTVLPGLRGLAQVLLCRGGDAGHLVADPAKGSACKRWHLYLRWMVRHDDVDPGGWNCVAPSRLVVPLDTHMWRVCRGLGLTRRRTVGLHSALEITKALSRLAPDDPVKYDFPLMHASAAEDAELLSFLERHCGTYGSEEHGNRCRYP